jgi:hypothetical protein
MAEIGSNPARAIIANIFFLVENMNLSFARTRVLHRPEWKQKMHDGADHVK